MKNYTKLTSTSFPISFAMKKEEPNPTSKSKNSLFCFLYSEKTD